MRLAIIIPYRNRERNLNSLIKHLKWFLPKQEINNFHIFVAIQDDELPFNKGLLFNTVFKQINESFDYFIFHDVDLIPLESDYKYVNYPTHLSSEVEQFDYKNPYDGLFGGVSAFNKEDFIKINGYSNMFKGWGGEDDDLFNRILIKGLIPHRKSPGRFLSLWHEKDPKSEIGNNVETLKNNLEKYKSTGIIDEGLSTADPEFRINEIEEHLFVFNIVTK